MQVETADRRYDEGISAVVEALRASPGLPLDFPTLTPPTGTTGTFASPRSEAGLQTALPVDCPFPDGQPLVAAEGNLSPGYLLGKRIVDVVGALALLTVLAPIMLAVFLVLLITTRGRPLFRQLRAGYRGRPFSMLKFRTMTLDAVERRHEVPNEKDGPIFKNRRDPRVTRIGQLLRKTSLDETPQLFHVLLGQMSLVGPRPLPVEEVAQFTPRQRRRLAVKPGLTCLWQVSGRCELGFEDWVKLDLWYVRNQSTWTDLRLLLTTPKSVLSGRGAY